MGLPLLFVFGTWVCAQAAFLEVTTTAVTTDEVTTDDKGLLYSIPLSDHRGWIMRWNHSVTGVTVSDYYRWDGERMLLTDSHTPAFDAGLGHIQGRGTLSSDGQNGYWITDIDEPVPGASYLLRVGSTAVNHRVVHNNVSYSLSKAAANKRVRIEVVVR